MPLYPLGISRRQDVPNVPKQAAGSIDMRWSFSGELACAFIDAPHQAVPPMLHAAALDAIHRRICVLPVRFGLALPDEAEIHALLHERRQELIDHLSRLDWTCEMGLRIVPSTTADQRRPAPVPCLPLGTPAAAASQPTLPLAYLEERRTHYRRVDEDAERDRRIVQEFVDRLNGCYRQWRELKSSPLHPIRLAFLIGRDCVAAFRNRAESAYNADPEGRCAILGPWPPYSFV